MSKAVAIAIADALVAALNASELSQEFEAVRAYRAVYELTDMDTLHVTVCAGGLAMVPEDRGRDRFEYVIDVGVQKRFRGGPSVDDLDAMMLLVEQVMDLFRSQPLAVSGLDSCRCVAAENPASYVPDHIEKFHQFTSFVRLTFRTWRKRS